MLNVFVPHPHSLLQRDQLPTQFTDGILGGGILGSGLLVGGLLGGGILGGGLLVGGLLVGGLLVGGLLLPLLNIITIKNIPIAIINNLFLD
jgi:hypothetical protein